MKKVQHILVLMFFLIAPGCLQESSNLQEQEEKRVKIVAFGDSITATRSTIDSVFAQRVAGLLKPAGYKAVVINSGVGGSHSGRLVDNDRHNKAHALDRFDTAVINHNPDLTTIGFGMNDCWVDSDNSADPSRISKEDFRSNMALMIDSLQSNDSEVILIAPNPLGTRFEEWRDIRLLEYVDIILSLAEEYETGLVNNNELFREYAAEDGQVLDELLLDGLHPNDRGHKLIAAALVEKIKKTLSD